jgi:hypothetical protein
MKRMCPESWRQHIHYKLNNFSIIQCQCPKFSELGDGFIDSLKKFNGKIEELWNLISCCMPLLGLRKYQIRGSILGPGTRVARKLEKLGNPQKSLAIF